MATLRADNSIQASLVNVGLTSHPATGEPVLGFVTYGRVKLANLRARPRLAVTFRAGWQWATVKGNAEIVGRTTRSRGWSRTSCRNCCAPSSGLPAAVMTTGTSTTG